MWNNTNPQVHISCHNAMPFMAETLSSVERCMLGVKQWGLFIADDGSDDDTKRFLTHHKTSANTFIWKSFPKATYLGQAKNRTFKLAKEYKDTYNGVLVMDADDIMLNGRIDLLNYAASNNLKLAVGSFYKNGAGFDDDNTYCETSITSPVKCDYGLWATVFHSSLIPSDGRLFREDVHGFDDGCLNAYWLSKGIVAKHIKTSVHIYRRRNGTVYTPKNNELNTQILDKHRDIIFEYFLEKEIDTGIIPKVTLYTNFIDGIDLHSFINDVTHCVRTFFKHPTFELLIYDSSSSGELFSTIKFSFAKEIACGILKIFRSSNDQRKIANHIVSIAKTDKLVYLKLSDFTSFGLYGLINSNTNSAKSIGRFMIFNKAFLKKANENSVIV